MNKDCDIDFLSGFDDAWVGLDREFVLSGCFELDFKGFTLKMMGVVLVFLIMRAVGRCFPDSYERIRSSSGLNSILTII